VTPRPSVELRPILEAVERDDPAEASALLRRAEYESFYKRGDRIAGELAYIRWRLEGGDRAGAEDALRRLVERSSR